MSGTTVIVIACFVGLAAVAGILCGYAGALAAALMGASCWYGHALGYERGYQAGLTWYADMLRGQGWYR